MAVISLQNILDDTSYLLGESGTPVSEVGKRTRFANDAAGAVAKIRNWSWELQTGDAVNFVYSATPTNNAYTYVLTPTAGVLKDRNAIYTLSFTDQHGTITYFTPCDEPTMDFITVNGKTDNVFYIQGNAKDGFTLVVNANADALPTQNVTGAWKYRYFATVPDFVALTDGTPIPSIKVLSEYVASEVFFGYREQSQYELARQRYQDTLEDLSLKDMKASPFQSQSIMTFRNSIGASGNFKTYF